MKSALLSLPLLLCAAAQLVSLRVALPNVEVSGAIASGAGSLSYRNFVKVLVMFFDAYNSKFICEGIKFTETFAIVQNRCGKLLAGRDNVHVTIGLDIAEVPNATYNSGLIYGYEGGIHVAGECGGGFYLVRMHILQSDPVRNVTAILPSRNCNCQPSSLTIYHSLKPQCKCTAGNHQRETMSSLVPRFKETCIDYYAISDPIDRSGLCVGSYSGLFHPGRTFPLLLAISASGRYALDHGSKTKTLCISLRNRFIDLTEPKVIDQIKKIAQEFGEVVKQASS